MLRSANVSRALSLTGVLALLAVAGCEPTNMGYAPDQPIFYSHAVHAGALAIPCLYCHFGAEKGRYAGIPPTSVCMNCHKEAVKDHPEVIKVAEAAASGTPIPWVRVHFLPDHVYFNHSVHVGADVACQECHGPVETMERVMQFAPLTMGWCLTCHRAKGEGVAEPPTMTGHAGPLTDCAVCHH